MVRGRAMALPITRLPLPALFCRMTCAVLAVGWDYDFTYNTNYFLIKNQCEHGRGCGLCSGLGRQAEATAAALCTGR